ncbi:MAG: NAD(P)H-dependent oxidoreductase [Bacteroidota bacterium]
MNILIINGHPGHESFSEKASQAIQKGAHHHCVKVLALKKLEFDLSLRNGYRGNELEADLIKAQSLIQWADHLIWVYPTWWWNMPALLKGFIDRVFVPGFAFQYEEGATFQTRLLKGKTASIILSMDSPAWYNRVVMRNVVLFNMRKGILDFCGIKTKKVFVVDNYHKLSAQKKAKWLRTFERLGSKLAA